MVIGLDFYCHFDAISLSTSVAAAVLVVAGWTLGHRRRQVSLAAAVIAGAGAYGVRAISDGETYALAASFVTSDRIVAGLKFFATSDLIVAAVVVACCWLATGIDKMASIGRPSA